MQTTEELQAALLIASEGMQAAKRIIERKNKQLLAAEAEIARLQSGLDELKKTCNDVLDLGVSDEFERGWDRAHHRVLRRIEGIIGTDK